MSLYVGPVGGNKNSVETMKVYTRSYSFMKLEGALLGRNSDIWDDTNAQLPGKRFTNLFWDVPRDLTPSLEA